jgi:hypothetical protein
VFAEGVPIHQLLYKNQYIIKVLPMATPGDAGVYTFRGSVFKGSGVFPKILLPCHPLSFTV